MTSFCISSTIPFQFHKAWDTGSETSKALFCLFAEHHNGQLQMAQIKAHFLTLKIYLVKLSRPDFTEKMSLFLAAVSNLLSEHASQTVEFSCPIILGSRVRIFWILPQVLYLKLPPTVSDLEVFGHYFFVFWTSLTIFFVSELFILPGVWSHCWLW